MIKKLFVFDFDGTLYNSELPETGKVKWEKVTGEVYPHKGWWGRPESLDIDIFDNKPFSSVLRILNNANNDPEAYVMILTSRQEKLRPYLENILKVNNIKVDEVQLKSDNRDKGQRVLSTMSKLKELNTINVYDDRDIDITAYNTILNDIPKNIVFNIYLADNGNVNLVNSNLKINEIIVSEVRRRLGI